MHSNNRPTTFASSVSARLGKKSLVGAAAVALASLAATPSNAAILFGPQDLQVAVNSRTDVVTLTDADLAGATSLVITYSVTRGALGGGDAWFVLGANAAGTGNIAVATNSDFGALTRTRTDVSGGDNSHEFFQDGAANGSPASLFTSAGNAVRITLLTPTGFTGSSIATYEVDEGTTLFMTADKTMTQTIDWDRTPGVAAFSVATNGAAHSVQNLTFDAVPEPATAVSALLGAGLLLGRRQRRASSL